MGPEGRRRGLKPPIHALLSVSLSPPSLSNFFIVSSPLLLQVRLLFLLLLRLTIPNIVSFTPFLSCSRSFVFLCLSSPSTPPAANRSCFSTFPILSSIFSPSSSSLSPSCSLSLSPFPFLLPFRRRTRFVVPTARILSFSPAHFLFPFCPAKVYESGEEG